MPSQPHELDQRVLARPSRSDAGLLLDGAPELRRESEQIQARRVEVHDSSDAGPGRAASLLTYQR